MCFFVLSGSHFFVNTLSFLKIFFIPILPNEKFDSIQNKLIIQYKALLNIVNPASIPLIVKVANILNKSMVKPKKYRDRIYIVKDIILTLAEYGQLNQTSLFSFCGLNITKHKQILDNLEQNEMIQRVEIKEGKRIITIFKVTHTGMIFCNEIIEPFEKLFPRGGRPSTLNIE